MHAYLLIGGDNNSFNEKVLNLANKLDAKIIEYPILKIDDTRSLSDLLKLGFSEKTLIVSRNVHEASEEALNAFLKNLEEPQENIYFALTASNEKSVLSTIVSRCDVVRIKNEKLIINNSEDVMKFINMDTSEQLLFFDKIKDREKAIEFVNSLIFYLHSQKDFKYLEDLVITLKNLKLNGNISLQLTSLVARMGSVI